MIKQMTVAMCDFCGSIEPARVVDFCKNEEIYDLPAGWAQGMTDGVHFCPKCLKKLEKNNEVAHRG